MELNDKIVIYRTADGQTSIDVKLEDETVWLSANQMANLFDRDEKTIRKHINNVFSEGELEKEKRLSQNRVEMASFVLFQIEVIWIFLKKRSLQTYFFHSNCFLLV